MSKPSWKLTYWCAALSVGLLLWSRPVGAAVEVGSPAPAFCLPAQDGETQDGQEVCLSDFRGKRNVLLLFYILDFTPG